MHHVMGEIEGKGVWYCVKGGMGALSDYLAKLAKERGVDVRTESDVD
jgi:phytoene dehydrogenase-like protein